MNVEVVLFDCYGTLLDMTTDERRPEVWETLARYLRYQGLSAEANGLYKSFTAMAYRAQQDSDERYPETDVKGIFGKILEQLGNEEPDRLSTDVCRLFRALSIVRMGLFDDTMPALEALHPKFKLGLVSDAQRVFLEPEIKMTGLAPLLSVKIISTDHGFHKPDRRLFEEALHRLDVAPDKVVFVGDCVKRDICGAQSAKIPAVLLARDCCPAKDESLCDPYKMIQSLRELCDWLLS